MKNEIAKKWFKEVLEKKYEENKASFLRSVGGLVAFNYNYYEELNDKKIDSKWEYVEELENNHVILKTSIRLVVEEKYQTLFNDINVEKYPEYIRELFDIFDFALEESKEKNKNKDHNNKNFVSFLWFIEDFENEIEYLVELVQKDYKKAPLNWMSKKYQTQGDALFRLSPIGLKHINEQLKSIFEAKRIKKEAAEKPRPQLYVVKTED